MKIPNFILLYIFFIITANLFAQSSNGNLVVSIGGTIWGEEDNDGTIGIGESGISRVWVHLFNMKTFQLDSIETDNYGNYLFKYKTPGIYVISLREKNFTQGAPLYGLNSCSGQANDIFTDNDDNGDVTLFYINSEVLDLTYSGSQEDTITNTTFDFCLNADCGTPNPIAVHSELEIMDTICDIEILSIFCSRMGRELSMPSRKLCDGQLNSYNMDLFRFTAGTGDYKIDINLFGCVGGLSGAQVGVHDKNNKTVYCTEGECTTGLKAIPSSVLKPGQVYTLWLNGCEGSVCSYEINITGDFVQFEVPEVVSIDCSNDINSLCLGDTTFFMPIGIENSDFTYEWQITKPNNNKHNIISKKLPFGYVFSEKGSHKVELLNVNAKCALPIIPSSLDVNVIETGDCNNIRLLIQKLLAPMCDKNGYFIANIGTANGIPFKVYLNDSLKIERDTYAIESGGLYTFKVIDSLGQSLEKSYFVSEIYSKDSFDLDVNFNSSNFVRGFKSYANLVVNNFSCKSTDATVSLKLPSEVKYLNANPSPSSDDGNGNLIWDLQNFIESKTFVIELETRLTSLIGDNINITTSIAPLIGDVNTYNNKRDYTYQILGAFDPNDINIQPYGKCTERYLKKDQPLNYTIRFQNTGNYPASIVSIIDTLSNYIDINSVKVVGQSHNVILQKLDGNVLKFNFPNIYLPSEIMDARLSNGFVSFDISLKDSIPATALLKNKAEIYFDFNEAIVTNTIFNTLVDQIPEYYSTQDFSICDGDSLFMNGHYFTKDTSFSIAYLAKDLCDSIVKYNIRIKKLNDVVIVNKDDQLSTSEVYDEYTWIDCATNAVLLSTTAQTFNPTYTGSFKVKVSKDGCSKTSSCIPFVTRTLEQPLEDLVTIFPNPSIYGKCTIVADLENETIESIIGYTLLGQKVNLNIQAISENKYSLSYVKKGIYMLDIKTQKHLIKKKIVIE